MYPSSHLQIECGFLSFLCFMQYCVWGLCFRKKNVWWLWYGSSSCLCYTLLKGNCLEGHQNLKGIVYGVIKISPSINLVMPFLPLPRKKDAFAKVFMLHKPSFDIQITKFLIILNISVQCDVSWENMEPIVGAEEQKKKTELIRVLVGFSFHLCWIHLSYLAITYFMITLKNSVHFCDVCWEDM